MTYESYCVSYVIDVCMHVQTVVELPNYIAQAERLLTKEEQAKVIQIVANNPEWGVVIQGTGGIRKARFAKGHKGKSGGARVIYYTRNDTMPIIMLAMFGKNEKDNLTKAERNQLAVLVQALDKHYRKGRRP